MQQGWDSGPWRDSPRRFEGSGRGCIEAIIEPDAAIAFGFNAQLFITSQENRAYRAPARKEERRVSFATAVARAVHQVGEH